MRPSPMRPAIGTILCMLALSSCMVGPRYEQPQALPGDPPSAYKESPSRIHDTGDWRVAQPQDALLRGAWWEVFHDPQLNALESQLDITNQNIKQSFQNFMASRALIGEANAQLYPSVTLSPLLTVSHTPASAGAGGGGNVPVTKRTSTIIQLPIDVSWETDLWGKVRSAINQAVFSSQLSAADLENERLTEQTTLAAYVFQIRGQDRLQAILNDSVQWNGKLVDFARAQAETGIGDQLAVVQAQNTLLNAQATASAIAIARAQYEHAIAVLLGRNPSQFSLAVMPAIVAPPVIPIGVPSQLLERRPDIVAAERLMAAANAQIGVAAAAYYPDVTLGLTAGFESSSLGTLLEMPSFFWSAGPSLSYTVYDAGLRRSTENQYVAAYNAAVAAYRQTVLAAFQQVEDNLAGVRILAHEVEQSRQAMLAADAALRLTTDRYETGVDAYVTVITAQTTVIADQQTLVNLQIQELVTTVQLIAALGGGWDRSQLPSTQKVSQDPSAQETKIQQ